MCTHTHTHTHTHTSDKKTENERLRVRYFSKQVEGKPEEKTLVGKAHFGHGCEGPPGLAHGT